MYDKQGLIGPANYSAQDSLRQMAAEQAERSRYSDMPPPSPVTTGGRSELASALDAQERATHELLAIVDVLTQKLAPVLSPTPEKDCAGSGERGYGSQIAGCIASNTTSVRSAIGRLSSLVRDLAV